MKLTKKLEAEVLKVYKAYWEAYLSGDMKTFASMLDDNITVFGTAVSEVFNNKTEALKFYKTTADQLTGKAQFRNREISLKTVDNNVLLNEQCDFYVLIEKVWTFYGHARVTAILKQTKSGWKLVHQHASFPDVRAEEGEQVAAEKIKEENIQLRDAVKRRTIELEEKNRELEVETALEKVRSVAMGMKEAADMLGICKIIAEQLGILGIKQIRNVQTAVFKKPATIYLNYEYFPLNKKRIITEVDYTLQPDIKAFAKRMLKASGTFYTKSFDEHELKEWTKYQKKANQYSDPRQKKAKSLHYYFFSIDNAALGISIYNQLNKEEINLFKKFRNVFELAYKRFIDIQKAEAQAREAQIEVAVERVRAKALAMHRSEEIGSVANTLRKELASLNIPGIAAATITLQQENNKIRLWDITSVIEMDDGFHFAMDFVFDLKETKPNDWIRKIWDAKEKYFFYKQDKKGFKRTLAWTRKYDPAFATNAQKFIETNNIKNSWHPVVPLAYGKLSLDLLKEPVGEVESILTKMAAAFDLAYKRFLDLQRAEAQTREAEIELALERVRAKTMAMHKSSDLLDVVKTLGEQFELLGFKFDSVNFNTDYKEKDWKLWLYNSGSAMYPGQIHIPYIDHPIFNRVQEVFKNGADFQSFIFTKEEKDSFFDHIYANSVAKYGSEERKRYTYSKPGMTLSVAVSKNTSVTITNYDGRAFSENENAILRRFANVFEQTYTRFLDLQKAEAQAREGQIQLALERVRARTMAMHRSDELTDVVKLLYQEFDKLKLSNESTDIEIGLINEETGMAAVWAHLYLSDGTISTFDFPIGHFEGTIHEFKEWKATPVEKRNELFFTSEFKGKLWNKFIKWLTKFPELAEAFQPMIEAKINQWVTHNAYFSHGILTLQGVETYSPETLDIQKRFTKVFEQTYTRFLDLKKAEGQAREAQIEAALERVRARTMGMHQSKELHDVIEAMTTQLLGLGLKFDNSCFCRINKDKSWELWLSTPQQSYPALIHLPYIDHRIFNRLYERLEFFEDEYEQKEAIVFFRHFFENSIARNVPEERKQLVYKSKGITRSGFLVRDIWFVIVRYDIQAFNDEENAIIKRFAKVFEQSYTRFLDLQKAEAQAREAQIEAGLERVRSRAMAMQSSEELNALIGTVFSELTKLDLALTRCVIWLFDPKKNEPRWWMANSEEPSNPMSFLINYHDHPAYLSFLNEWKKQTVKFVYDLKGQDKISWDDILFNKTELKHLPDVVKNGMRAPERVLLSASFNNFGGINVASLEPLSEEHFDILLRFAKVFDLTYTRFNDLKQAEAQAREAQIQLALERVRARSMAMQKSSELSDTAFVLFQQFKELGAKADQFSIGIINEEEEVGEMYATIQGDQLLQQRRISIHEPIAFKKVYTAWKEKKENLVLEIKGKELETYNIYRNKIIGRKIFPEKIKNGQRWNILCSFFSRGVLSFASSESPSEEILQLLERFAKVFDGTYTRFLDLQKAEAQAREAKVELALERIRVKVTSMQVSSDLLDIVVAMRNEFVALGHEAHYFWYMRWLPEKYEKAMTSGDGTRIGMVMELPRHIHGEIPLLARREKSEEPSVVFAMEVETAVEYIDKMIRLGDFKQVDHNAPTLDDIRHIGGLTFVMARTTHGEIGYSLQGVVANPPSEDIANLVRFAAVFDLAYRRFEDLKESERRNRETQIELALEKVRSRTMAMRQSDELAEVVAVLYKQFEELDFGLYQVLVSIYDRKNSIIEWWSRGLTEKELPQRNIIPLIDHPFSNDLFEKWESGIEYYPHILEGELKESWEEYLFTQTDLKNFPDEVKDIMRSFDKVYLSDVFMKYGSLQAAGPAPLPDDKADILKRFVKVLDLAYTRMMDLQNAEAQAREAQIEAALERVRSRSLAMHKSDELQEVVNTVFERLTELKVAMDSCNIAIFKESSREWEYWIASNFQKRAAVFYMPYTTLSLTRDIVAAKESGVDFSSKSYSFEEKNEWFEYAFKETDFKHLTEERKKFILGTPGITVSIAFSKYTGVQINQYAIRAISDGEKDILKRFSKVFEQAYIRFLDLDKAEAQAREAQIEASLERVRSKTMAMHSSNDLLQVTQTLSEQFVHLGFGKDETVGFITDSTEEGYNIWLAAPGDLFLKKFYVPRQQDKSTQVWKEAKERGDSFYSFTLTKEEKDLFFRNFFENTELKSYPEEAKQVTYDAPGMTTAVVLLDNITLTKSNFTGSPYTDEQNAIIKRFAFVFQQSYTRFLDLQKAEAQAREAQIEASLERVRSKTMAMHNSNDVGDTVAAMFAEFVNLGIHTNRCGILIFNDENIAEVWTAKSDPQGKASLIVGRLDLNMHNLLRSVHESWKTKGSFYQYDMTGDDLINYYKALNQSAFYKIKFDIEALPSKEFHSDFFFPEGAVFSFTAAPIPEEHSKIFKRFAGVFGQTYRRYLDLQKAEAQAKEARIEISLERIRARALAMHSSDELMEVAKVLREQMALLGQRELESSVVHLYKLDPGHVHSWRAVSIAAESRAGFTYGHMAIPVNCCEVVREWLEKFNSDQQEYTLEISGEKQDEWYLILEKLAPEVVQSMRKENSLHEKRYYRFSKFSGGALLMISKQPPSEEAAYLQKKAAVVFDLAYRRFSDLQKTEAQAREAQIEAALERVRGKAMAMHSSKDLATTIGVFYHELESLNLTPRRCGVGLIDKETYTAEISTMNATTDGQSIELVGVLDMRSHPVLKAVYDHWLTKAEYHPVLRGNEIKAYYQVVRPNLAITDFPHDLVQYGYFFFFDEGGVYAWTEKELNEDELKIYRRFTSVLSLTYKRYKDLKDAELRTLNAIKEAALDRIRADIASMRTISDLDRITPLIWNELTTLNVPFIRCGVFIMDDDQQLIHTFLSTPDGKAIAAFHLPYDTPGNISKVIENWRHKKIYTDHWDEEEFIQFADILMRQGALSSKEQYLKTIPHGGFHLHFLPFLQGMLYVGNTDKLNKEQVELIQHVADAFSTAYARYEDFNKLEAAKQQVENTLTDLKQAQQQLVQSEKMASLGELTAGIAHEIQNPLNFVNNFSDVSNELLEEMKNELEKGNKDDAIAIVEDVKQNLEKILHHGKRADAIVKGMLQHSRSSSGQKEMTDINILADEYLRLAYHGLRAKDKSFNAKFETHFDNNIGKVNVIPQDIGRVILNLINNAFYTVSEKKKKNDNGYEPTVTVTTLHDNGKIEIKVRDNGNGIPQKNLEKIFQPFFTTKPTGQGTGLGLSLAYDIITKGHGGELKVETKEGEGSEFIIQLPSGN